MRIFCSIVCALCLAMLPAGLFADGDAKPTVDTEVIAKLRFSIKNTAWKNNDSGLARMLTFGDRKVSLTVDGFTAGTDEWRDYGNGQFRTSGSLFTLSADGKTLFERNIAADLTRVWQRTENRNIPAPTEPGAEAAGAASGDNTLARIDHGRSSATEWRRQQPATARASGQKTRTLRAFAWTSADVSTQFETLEINAASKIKSAGTLEIDFCYGDGISGLEMESVALAVDGKIVSADEHTGNSGFPFSTHNARYTLTVPRNAVGNRNISLLLRIRSFGNCNTSGNIVLGGEATRATNEKPRGGFLGESVRRNNFWAASENNEFYYLFAADGVAWVTIADHAGERWMTGTWKIAGNNPARLKADFSQAGGIYARGRRSSGDGRPRMDFPDEKRPSFVVSKDGKTLTRDDGAIFVGLASAPGN